VQVQSAARRERPVTLSLGGSLVRSRIPQRKPVAHIWRPLASARAEDIIDETTCWYALCIHRRQVNDGAELFQLGENRYAVGGGAFGRQTCLERIGIILQRAQRIDDILECQTIFEPTCMLRALRSFPP
jgi:hypothetical protein